MTTKVFSEIKTFRNGTTYQTVDAETFSKLYSLVFSYDDLFTKDKIAIWLGPSCMHTGDYKTLKEFEDHVASLGSASKYHIIVKDTILAPPPYTPIEFKTDSDIALRETYLALRDNIAWDSTEEGKVTSDLATRMRNELLRRKVSLT